MKSVSVKISRIAILFLSQVNSKLEIEIFHLYKYKSSKLYFIFTIYSGNLIWTLLEGYLKLNWIVV